MMLQHLKLLFRSERLTLVTQLRVEQCREGLRERLGPWWTPIWTEQRPVQGRISSDRFDVTVITFYHNSGKVHARGRLAAHETSTHIALEFGGSRWGVPILCFYYGWFVLVGTSAFIQTHPLISWSMLSSPVLWQGVGLIAVLLVAPPLMMVFESWLARHDREQLYAVLEETLLATPLKRAGDSAP